MPATVHGHSVDDAGFYDEYSPLVSQLQRCSRASARRTAIPPSVDRRRTVAAGQACRQLMSDLQRSATAQQEAATSELGQFRVRLAADSRSATALARSVCGPEIRA